VATRLPVDLKCLKPYSSATYNMTVAHNESVVVLAKMQ